jgi:hypothetical protein
VSVDGLQEPKAQMARAAHTLKVCANGTWPMNSFLFSFYSSPPQLTYGWMGTSPDEDLISYVHVAHGLEVSSQTNNRC